MRRQITRILVLTMMAFIGTVSADQTKSNNRHEDSPTDSVEPKFGELTKARSLLGQQVKAPGKKGLGTVQDLVLDLETGNVALVVVEIDPNESSTSAFVALPMIALKKEGQGFQIRSDVKDKDLAAARKLEIDSLSTVFNRAWAMVEYTTFGSKPYWAEAKIANNDQFDRQSYRLSLLSALQDQLIVNDSGEPIGEVKDFAIACDTGLIAYAAVKLAGDESDKRYPVPLGSFVVRAAEQPWKIELNTETIRSTPSFSANQWPTKVERAWVEYIHVRYGRSPLGGVQHKQHSKSDK